MLVRTTRALTLVYAVVLAATHPYSHQWIAGLTLGVMIAWSIVASTLLRSTDGWVIGLDVALTWGAVAATALAESATAIDRGDATLASAWSVSAVVAASVVRGPWVGAVAGLVVASAFVVVRGDLPHATVGTGALLLVMGVLAARVERAELPPAPPPTAAALASDLMQVLRGGDDLSVEGPEGPVVLDPETVEALAGAVTEAVDNVHRHAGAPAHVFVHDYVDHVEVVVQDDGSGFDAAAVAPAGRGLRSMVEQLMVVGGSMSIRSAPGEGTTITFSAPRDASIT